MKFCKLRTLLVEAVTAVTLCSCQTSFDMQLLNQTGVAITAKSNDSTSTIRPGESAILPFPSKQNGSILRVTSSVSDRCYPLGFDLDRNGARLITKHKLHALLDEAFRLHLPAANSGGTEEVAQPQHC
jgi:hypothetical protein